MQLRQRAPLRTSHATLCIVAFLLKGEERLGGWRRRCVCRGGGTKSKWAFLKFFWRLALSGSLKGETRTFVHIGGWRKGGQVRAQQAGELGRQRERDVQSGGKH